MSELRDYGALDFPVISEGLAQFRAGAATLTKHHYGLCITPHRRWGDECRRLVHIHQPLGVNLIDLDFVLRGDLSEILNDVQPMLLRLAVGASDLDFGSITLHAARLEVVVAHYRYDDAVDFSIFPRLRKLHLRGMAKHWTGIEDVTTMEDLSLYGGPKFRSFDHFRRLKRLRSLTLIKGGIEELGFTFKRPNLRELEICHCYKFASLEGLEKVPNLRRLEIVSAKKIASIDAIAQLKDLEWLTLDGCGSHESLEPILQLKKLQYLSLTDSTKVTDPAVLKLLELPNLKVAAFQPRRYHNEADVLELRRELSKRRVEVGGDWAQRLQQSWRGDT